MKKLLLLLLLLPLTTMHAGELTINFTAVIENRVSDSLVIYWADYRQVIKAAPGENFKAVLKVPGKGVYAISDGVNKARLILDNGFDLIMQTDARDFAGKLTFRGTGKDKNEFMALSKKAKPERWANKSDSLTYMSSKFNNDVLDKQQAAMDDAEKKIKERKNSNGKQSPDFLYENAKGGLTTLKDFRGKYVYIDIWATWCAPCRQEIPFLKKAEERYHGKKIVFVSISVDKAKDHDKWKKMVTEQALGGVQLIADKDWSSPFIQSFGITSIPRFIIIDPEGKVVDADAKRPSDPALKEQLDTLLK